MQTGIRLIAQHYNAGTGQILEETILREDRLTKATTLKELGYLHVDQIDLLQKIQDFRIKPQIALNAYEICPICQSKTQKTGIFKSKFHAALTDHKVCVQRVSCKCGWVGKSSIEGIYGSSMHPDLLEKQALQGGKESYEKSSVALNAESACKRAVNSHSQIYRSVKNVGQMLKEIKKSEEYGKGNKAAAKLIANIDGGHIKERGDKRSFEAMVATIYCPENLKYIDKNHNIITAKTSVASANDDSQETMKALFRSGCRAQGMTVTTQVTCLADSAENCWSIAHSIQNECAKVEFILDWFHIAMKFKNISIPKEHRSLYDKIKWHLWHGRPTTALLRLGQLKTLINDDSTLMKLIKLEIYINNNKEGIVNYSTRKRNSLVYTSNVAEGTVNDLINERQKGKQKMLWSRDGAHNVLQIRSSVASKSWKSDWKKVESQVYKIAA